MMRTLTWNIHGAGEESGVWALLLELNPDIALLQEVGDIPNIISDSYAIFSKNALRKDGSSQRFSTAILTKGKILKEITLKSEYEWVNRELELFQGNLIACKLELENKEKYNVVSVYSPAWPVDKKRYAGIDVSSVKLKENPDVWVTEILWSALKNTVSKEEQWIVGGDYNSSETFDPKWREEHGICSGLCISGNKEILDRMVSIGFTECLRKFNGKLVPTFKHSTGGIKHQLDHLFVTESLYSKLTNCAVGNQSTIFDNYLSDHLPIIADFDKGNQKHND